jgi:hypothetical protein
MVKLIPPVNFCSDENIQTIFGTKLEDFLNYRIDYNSISVNCRKSCEKNILERTGIIVRRAVARIAFLSAQPAPDQIPLQSDIYKIVEEKHFEQFL